MPARGRRSRTGWAVKGGGVVWFRGPLGPRVPAEAGVPSRFGVGAASEYPVPLDSAQRVPTGGRPSNQYKTLIYIAFIHNPELRYQCGYQSRSCGRRGARPNRRLRGRLDPLTRALELRAPDADLLGLLTTTHLVLGDEATARRFLDQAYAPDPEHEKVLALRRR